MLYLPQKKAALEWKPIVRYEGHYDVSEDGDIYSHKTNKILKQMMGTSGYWRIGLCANGQPRGFYVHRIVAEAFVPNPDNKPHINHLDSNKLNNRYTNLEWCTPKENVYHALNESGNLKITDDDARIIREKLISREWEHQDVKDRYGLSSGYISCILYNIWHTDDEYTPPEKQYCNPSKISMAQARQIRDIYRRGGYSQLSLAKKFNLGHTIVGKIIHNTSRRHYDPTYVKPKFNNRGIKA